MWVVGMNVERWNENRLPFLLPEEWTRLFPRQRLNVFIRSIFNVRSSSALITAFSSLHGKIQRAEEAKP